MAENEDKIVLTLGEEKVEEEVVTEESKETVQEHANVPVSDVVGYAKLDDSSLTEDEKKMVDDFAKQIDIMETNTVLQYGATAQSKVADFSDTALKNVRTKDIDTVGAMEYIYGAAFPAPFWSELYAVCSLTAP